MIVLLCAELPAGNIREGLTKAKRARDSTSEAMSGIVSAMPDVKKGREEVTAVKALAGVGPQADLPPVLAGPGRCGIVSSCNLLH